jgi:hypothetical protein
VPFGLDPTFGASLGDNLLELYEKFVSLNEPHLMPLLGRNVLSARSLAKAPWR